MKRITIEKSREIRQWLNLGGKAVGGLVTLDMIFNNGDTTRRLVNNAKTKIAELKLKREAKRQEIIQRYENVRAE